MAAAAAAVPYVPYVPQLGKGCSDIPEPIPAGKGMRAALLLLP
jgi:hypothetical protein